RGLWSSIGWERSIVGYPATDELPTPDGIGAFNHFQNGSIYWSPATGAHEIHGAIRGLWASIGWERSIVGYPVTDEQRTSDGIGAFNHFSNGSIYWSPATGAHEIHGGIQGLWASLGWEQSYLGYPTSDELGTEDGAGRFQEFQRGSIYWYPSTGPLACQQTVRLHVKVLTTPSRFSINQMIANMRLTYATARVGVKFLSYENLRRPDLNDLDVGQCLPDRLTAEQNALYANRNSAGPQDVVVYMVRSTVPPYTGAPPRPPAGPALRSPAPRAHGRWRMRWGTSWALAM
ncbi:MAG: LGFP repeat-containing protein, partial [Acidimicrobiales bacterium]